MIWISQNKSKAFICRELNCRPPTLESYLIKLNITYGGNKNLLGVGRPKTKKTAYELSLRKEVNSHRLKLRLIDDGVKSHKCEICELTEWKGEKIPIELHHIDGNRFNNLFENLQIVCPNCHSQTDNYSGKKNKKVSEVKIKKKSIDRTHLRKVERPEIDVLLKEINDIGYSGVGRKYGVSDNAVRKWVKNVKP